MIGMKKDKAQAISVLSQFVPKAQKFSAKVNSYNDYIQEQFTFSIYWTKC